MVGVRIVADVHEARSAVPRHLVELGVSVDQRPLLVGDYDLGATVLVERKTAVDLHASVVQGRYWAQVGRLRRAAGWPFLLLEGDRLEGGPVSVASVRGILLSTLEQGVCLLRSHGPADSAAWLVSLAERTQKHRHRYRPRFAQIPKSRSDDAAVAMLAAIPGISTVTATDLLERFGSVAAVAAADEEALLAVRGLGPRRLSALTRALHETSSSPSSLSDEGPGPST